VEHRYQLSNQTIGGWLWRRVKGYLVGGVLGLFLLSGLYALLWASGHLWWLWATVGWLVVTLVLGQLLPILILPLFYKVTRLDDESLLQRFRNLTNGTTLTVEGVYRLGLSKDTKKANAALAGLGKTRRVLLGDTLLEQFTPEEIEVVFAHEVGHHVHRHIIKMIALRVLTTLVGFRLVDALLATIAPRLGYTHFTDPAALPLVLLVLTLFGLILSPLQNALSRFYERQCDQYALDRTGNPVAYRSAFIKLARINKSNPDPHPLVACLFYDHPPIRERLAMAEAGPLAA
jgi:STE24 endopeptidase